MSKKIVTACMAVFALAAFILPASASAANSPVITHPTGTRYCEKGGETCLIKATNITTAFFKNDEGTAILSECSKATMTGWVAKNEGTTVEGNITTTAFSGTGAEVGGVKECTGTFGNLSVITNEGNGTPWCVRSTGTMAEDEFQVRGGKCSEAARSITFDLNSTTAGKCKYNRAATEPIKGTYTTDTPTGANFQDAVMHLTAGPRTTFIKEEGGILCPSTGTLEMSFTLETDAATAEPLFFS